MLNFKLLNMQDFGYKCSNYVRNIGKEQTHKLATHLHSLVPNFSDGKLSNPIRPLVVGSGLGM